MKGNTHPTSAGAKGPSTKKKFQTGFVLILVVGMLTVLVVLGLSYAEQGRVALRGASNMCDLSALDGLAEIGFQYALRAIDDDGNVRHAGRTPAHLAGLGGAGWSSRWGYNPDPTLGGALPVGADRGPSRDNPYNYQDTWRMLFWNEETVEPVAMWSGKAWGYGFKFRPGSDDQARRSMETQRYPQPPGVLLDTVQLQPFARVRKFRVRSGSSFGLVQVGITPKDGGLNLNDVFDPGTVDERPGVYETLPAGRKEGTVGLGAPYEITSADVRVPCASPDRRTLEYILGSPPQFANKNREPKESYALDSMSLRFLSGSTDRDNGLYNWRHFFEPYGGMRAYTSIGWPSELWIYDGTNGYGNKGRASTAIMTEATSGAPTTIWNVAGGEEPNRYGIEPSRFVMWASMKGMSYTADGDYAKKGIGWLVDPKHYGSNVCKDYLWFPTGLWSNDPRLPANDGRTGANEWHGADQMFHGFGFDRFNVPRAGLDGTYSAFWCPSGRSWMGTSEGTYIGAGAYGHPKARTFQLHFMSAVAQGRFWTDLLAAWYFGGAPGYTNFLGATQASGYNNWAHLGSSYDSLGIGTHWMPPTSHVWMPGFFSNGRLSNSTTHATRGGSGITGLPGQDEVSRGMTRWPGNMPPTRMAATYIVPMARWPADFVGQSNAHFTFNNFRISIRAHGIQENWGDPLNPGSKSPNSANNRWYDAIDINNTIFPIMYGLLTPEKIPSMLNRTAVAPHLHWKARMLDVECRLKRPVKIDGTPEPYDDVKNSWIPVQLGLRTPDAGKPYPGGDWDPDPASAGYNPWIPLRMKLKDPTRPWNPDAVTDPAVYNPWVEPKLLDKSKPCDPISNPFYNSAAFLTELQSDATVRDDYIRYPWMPSLKTPVEVDGATGNPKIDPTSNEAIIRYGMYNFDSGDLKTAAATWSDWIESSDNVGNFHYMPIETYGAAPTWCPPGPFDAAAAAYPSPGWSGYLFEPRWYTGRTVNPKYLAKKLLTANGADASTIGEVAEHYSVPGQAANGGGTSTVQSAQDPANAWDFASHASAPKLGGGLGALSGHRHVDPDRPKVVWSKMDFLTPEPSEYYDLNGDLMGYGSGRPSDDVFTDVHSDLSLQDMAFDDVRWNGKPHEQLYASAMARPDSFRNWCDWFSQRKRSIPGDAATVDRTRTPFRPQTNDVGGKLKWKNKTYYGPIPAIVSRPLSDGKTYSNADPTGESPQWDAALTSPPAAATPAIRRVVRGSQFARTYGWDSSNPVPEPDVKPHSIHGLPNPDYLLLYGGGPVSQTWSDQFRRYFPVQLEEINAPGDPYDDPDNNESTMTNNPYPGAMPARFKLVDDPDTAGLAAEHTAINPALPVSRATTGDESTPAVPAVSKDEAWRITRLGQRYQEIISNEIMDYQINPWWPNPCVPVSELCVPLDKHTYPSEPRAKVKVEALKGRARWRSYAEHMNGNETTIGARVPKYYAYFNRFWCRTNHKAVRDWAGDPNDPARPLGEPYRAITIAGNKAAGIPDELLNATEGKGMYPPTWQYFGQYPPAEPTFQDRIKPFPYNAMEDQLGDDWRYLAHSVVLMTEPNMQKASGRNHPFRNWADFVAFLGHLVYRSPLDPKATPAMAAANAKAVRSPLNGVDAYEVCHGGNADGRNQGKFFDGSKIRAGSGGVVQADALRSPIVAKEGFWPVAANYGRAPDAGADPHYPAAPAGGGWNTKEWNRRWDEMRGRNEAGLRVEHHYISERAANDVLVSFSNGRIGPIDFDGDGHVTMTRGAGSDLSVAKAEYANAKPGGDVVQQRLWDDGPWVLNHHWTQWALPPGYPWHFQAGNNGIVEFEEYDDAPGYDTSFANRDFWDTDANPSTMSPLNLKLGILPPASAQVWRKADKRRLIQNCVTLPIKFHSNTFRISVAVELSDGQYKEIYATRRYQKVISRVPDTTAASVHGPFIGEFIEHSSRAMVGVDPELSWLGVK